MSIEIEQSSVGSDSWQGVLVQSFRFKVQSQLSGRAESRPYTEAGVWLKVCGVNQDVDCHFERPEGGETEDVSEVHEYP